MVEDKSIITNSSKQEGVDASEIEWVRVCHAFEEVRTHLVPIHFLAERMTNGWGDELTEETGILAYELWDIIIKKTMDVQKNLAKTRGDLLGQVTNSPWRSIIERIERMCRLVIYIEDQIVFDNPNVDVCMLLAGFGPLFENALEAAQGGVKEARQLCSSPCILNRRPDLAPSETAESGVH